MQHPLPTNQAHTQPLHPTQGRVRALLKYFMNFIGNIAAVISRLVHTIFLYKGPAGLVSCTVSFDYRKTLLPNLKLKPIKSLKPSRCLRKLPASVCHLFGVCLPGRCLKQSGQSFCCCCAKAVHVYPWAWAGETYSAYFCSVNSSVYSHTGRLGSV